MQKLLIEIELPEGHAVSKVYSKPVFTEIETPCKIVRTAFAELEWDNNKLILKNVMVLK